MKLRSILLTVGLLSLAACGAQERKMSSENTQNTELAPIYIEPYYNSSPFKINVGAYSDRLRSDKAQDIVDLSKEIKANIDKVNIETLFVLSNRLYDLKKKDEAVYWYYTASVRRNVFKATAIDNRHGTAAGELAQALDAYKKLLGEYVNGYAFGNIDKNVEITKAVIADNAQMKSLAAAYPNLKFDDSKLAEAVKASVADREGFIKYMQDNKEDIMKQRKENGVENKY